MKFSLTFKVWALCVCVFARVRCCLSMDETSYAYFISLSYSYFFGVYIYKHQNIAAVPYHYHASGLEQGRGLTEIF